MVWPYDEETGPYGSVSQVPTGEWFGVDTTTGAWQRPGQPTPAPTLGAVSGADLGLDLDLTTPFPGAGQGYGVLAPGTPAIGQVSGIGAPPRATPSALPRPPGREPLSALMTPPQPTVWESIARGVGMATPQGRAILQDFDTRQQQQLQNRLTLRRQELQEAQNERTEIRDDFNSLLKISEIKSKALRKLYTDRYVADMQARGKTLPADFIEAFKAAGSDEAQAMVKFYQPLLQDLGLDPTAFAELVDQGGIKEVGEALTLAQKLKKDRTEQQRLATLDQISRGETLGDVSGVTPPAATPGSDQRPRGYVEAGGTQPVIGTEKLTPTFTAKANEVATRLGMNPQDLLRIIGFETGGTFDPAVKNRAGSGATGLIQFTEQTAKALGTTTEALAQMTPEEQLDYVEKYLAPYKGKLGSLKDAYLAVFKPAAIGQGLDTPLYTKDKDGLAYRQNAGLDTGNKGYVTVGDALAAVMRTTTGGGTMPAASDTRMQVAGPGAPAPTTPSVSPTDQAALTHLKQAIALKDRQIEAFNRVGGEEANRRADNVAKQRDVLQKEYDRLEDRLTEASRAGSRVTAEAEAKAEAERKRQAQPMLPEDRRKLLTGLRSDIRQEPTFKIYQQVRNGYQNVQVGAKSNSAVGDLAIINGLAKVLDPEGVVMTGEARNVEEAQGQLQRWFNTPQKFFEGDRLAKENRPRFLELARQVAQEKLTTAQKELRAVYEPLAKEGNIAFDQLLPLSDLKTPEGQSLLEDMKSGTGAK